MKTLKSAFHFLSFVVVLSTSLLSCKTLTAQKNYTITDQHLQQGTLNSSITNWQNFEFKNINAAPYYYDEKLQKQILKFENAKDYDKLVPVLEDYISKFGCENFSRDYELLWKLGQLYERDGKLAEAKQLYNLVLKNTDEKVEYIWQYYNKITVNEKDEYVPIKYYYELVDYRKQIDTLRPPRGVFLNMGATVNSFYEDYGPSLNINNNILLFTSKRNRKKAASDNSYNEDIFWAARMSEEEWMKAEPFEGVNTEFNEGSPCISRDGQTMFFIRCAAPDGFGNCDIYMADLISDGAWGNVRNLGAGVNGSGWDSHPSLSHSQDTLFFVSDRDGGFGSTDIYFSVLDKNGKWSKAQNMGPVINTKDAEVSPFYHPMYHVLYFSSNGHLLNFGNFDIFKSHRTNNGWTEPKNIGPLVNGTGEEFYFTIDSESKLLFYASSEAKNFKSLDLYSFPLPMEAQPMATTVFQGTLRDSVTDVPFEGIVSIIDLENGIEVAPKYIREDGSFSFDLINDNKYLLIIQGDNFFRIEQIFDLKGDTVMNFKAPSLNSVRIKFESIEFSSNSWDILPDMVADLDKILNFLIDNPTFRLKISGHTDSQGQADVNNSLSQKRADAIKNYLVTKGGIAAARIAAKGYGSAHPIVKDEKTEEDRRLNRRVEFEIIREGKEGDQNWGFTK